jgi:hypothetical protein
MVVAGVRFYFNCNLEFFFGIFSKKKSFSHSPFLFSVWNLLLQKEIFLFFFSFYFTTRVNIPYFRKRGVGKNRKQKSITSMMIALVLCIDIYSYNEEEKNPTS